MKASHWRGTWRLAAFVVVCALCLFAVLTTYAQFRFQPGKTYTAIFANVSGLTNGNFVRIAGVEVGKVEHIAINPDNTVRVDFSADDTVVLTHGTRAAIRYDDLIGGRFMELLEGAGDAATLQPGQAIPMNQTDPALDLDAVIGGFKPLFRALDPDQVNVLSTQLIQAFQGQGATIASFLAQTASLTNTLADRDQLIGQVVTNLNTVLGSLGDKSDQFAKSIDSVAQLMNRLAVDKDNITNTVAYSNAAASDVADLLAQARPPLKEVIAQSDRASSIVLADHEYFDSLLKSLPDKYQTLSRLGIYGDFFSFYLCDVVLKLNGKGGQPVYVKVAGQPTGRCAPK